MARKDTKTIVKEAKVRVFNGLYQSLGTKEGKTNIYKLAKRKERKTRELDQVKSLRMNRKDKKIRPGKIIKDEEVKVLVIEQDIKQR